MNSADRRRALIFIWVAFGLAVGLAFVGNAETNVNDIFLALVIGLPAMIGTLVLVRFGVDEVGTTVANKSKRGDSDLYRMVDSMDDEELRALRRRLMVDSEASVSMQDLLSREQKQQQSQ